MEQFTASEVRDAITWKYGDKLTRISAMLHAFADLLEAQEKAAPSNAERLEEALRNLVSEWVAIADDGDATLEDSTIGYRACANRLSAMLAAHSAAPQPPAASATPNLASYWRIVAESAEVLQMVLDSCVTLPPDWRWPLPDELSRLSAMMLATQENPND